MFSLQKGNTRKARDYIYAAAVTPAPNMKYSSQVDKSTRVYSFESFMSVVFFSSRKLFLYRVYTKYLASI